MNILFTTVSLSAERGGGTAVRTQQLVRHFKRQNHVCSVAVIEDGALGDRLRADGTEIYATGSFKIRFVFPRINLGRLVKLVRNADIAHLLGYWNLLSVVTAFIAILVRRPYVLSAAGEFAVLDNPRPVSMLFHYVLGRLMIRKAQLIVAITELERNQILCRFCLPPERVIVIPNGVEEVTSGMVTQSRQSAFLLFVGRLALIKGPDLLIEAFARITHRFPDIHLVMAGGDFGMRKQLEALILRHSLSSRVKLVGHLEDPDRTTAFREALALIVPSRAEAMSLVALEAGAVGSPVLITNTCGFEAVERVEGGLVVPATIQGLADGMLRILDRQEALAEMGARLQSFVLAEYGWTSIVERFGAALERVVAQHNDACL